MPCPAVRIGAVNLHGSPGLPQHQPHRLVRRNRTATNLARVQLQVHGHRLSVAWRMGQHRALAEWPRAFAGSSLLQSEPGPGAAVVQYLELFSLLLL